ncbi:ANTAR domain-containing protein [Nocardiopsis ansamitocini]|uniref:ANTAR domain-containing protein n=1 Tax=Nocardiopsis ansamitocini TaxID=1670832 RepID=A0A9W6UGX8_9ACTN|nr:ANTAR domain-containing protein [Nocardiopsis ansamitocini]GLU45738.1 hypothetical protein Nans01_00890 [Nocardiopsis ansamitocini]
MTVDSKPQYVLPEALVHRNQELEEKVRNLTHALESRAVIDQAIGVIMAVRSCDSERAWTILSTASQRTNTKVREIASALTATAFGALPPETARPVRHALAIITSQPRRKPACLPDQDAGD